MSTTERLSQAIDHLGSADVQGREWDTAVTRLLMRAVEWQAAGCPGKEPARARRSALETLCHRAATWGWSMEWTVSAGEVIVSAVVPPHRHRFSGQGKTPEDAATAFLYGVSVADGGQP